MAWFWLLYEAMKRDIDCIGFVATETTTEYMRQVLNDIQHMSPSDSYVDATVEKLDDDYVATFSVRHSDGVFATQRKGENLKQVIARGAEDIKTQVDQWQKDRIV